MMIRTAGGPGLVSPLDFSERRRSMPPWMIAAIGVSVLAHVGAGAWLYTQRFEMTLDSPAPQPGPVTRIDLYRPPPPPVAATPEPAAPNPPIHRPITAPPVGTETLNVPVFENPVAGDSPLINLVSPSPTPSPEPTTTAPNPPAPPVITNPNWVSRPNADQLMRAYPAGALRNGVTGAVTLNCIVRVNGTLTDCSVGSETPAGQGFGRAAQGLSRHFRMSPRTVDGQAVDGASVAIGLRFTMPED